MWKRRNFLKILSAIGAAAPAAAKAVTQTGLPEPLPKFYPPPKQYEPVTSVVEQTPFPGLLDIRSPHSGGVFITTETVNAYQPVSHNWGLSYAADPGKSLPGGLEEQRRESENWRNHYAAEHIRYGYVSPETVALMTGKTIAAVVMLPDNCYGTNEDTLYWPERAQALRLIFTDGTAVDFQPTHDDSRVEVDEFNPLAQPAES